ncbi:MAG: hypothetical protein ABR887_05380 [Methanoregulaceae archaeon]|jgi:hypothetical protein
MKPKNPRRKKIQNQLIEKLTKMLLSALSNQDDFILTYEPTSNGNTDIHVMCGKLITPCMLGTLTNRADMQESEGCEHLKIESK